MQLISIPPLFNLNTDNQLNFMDKIIIDLSDIHYQQGWEVHVKKTDYFFTEKLILPLRGLPFSSQTVPL